MILMSIDGSTKSSGVAIFDTTNRTLLHYECITASESEKIKRINKMVKRFEEIYEEYQPNYIIMEEPLPEDVNDNQKTFKALIYLQAETAIKFYNDYQKHIDEFINVNRWRSVCGIPVGRFAKRELVKSLSIKLVKEKFGIDVNDDIADAVCIGWAWMCGIPEPVRTYNKKKKEEPSAF